MATKITEDTEITISLKELFSIIFFVIAVTGIVVRYEIKINDLVNEVDKQKSHIQQLDQHLNSVDQVDYSKLPVNTAMQ